MNLSFASPILTPDTPIDLHLHTLYSDGDWMPEQLMDYLVSEQFGLAAIADHDRADTALVLQQLARERHLPLLTAVEMTTLWRDEMTDLLCFGFEPGRNALDDLAQDLARRQRENIREVYENLRRQGHTLSSSADELAAILDKPSARQLHELVALLKKHDYGTGGTSAGKMVLEAGGAFATNDLAAAVEAAHRSGALCLIAHPGRGDGFMVYDAQLLDQLRQEIQIDGLEVYHTAHTPSQTAMYLNYARQHSLLVSSGSDSHRPEKKPVKYPAGLSRDLLARLGIKIETAYNGVA
jgi:predicted metal-dependent phosphoesterase TrpH